MDLFALLSSKCENGNLLLLFVTNVWYGHCTYMDCNTVSVMWRHMEYTPIGWFVFFSQNIRMFK